MKTRLRWCVMVLFFMLIGRNTLACEAMDMDFVYQGQVKAFYLWLLTLLISIPNLVITLKLPYARFWFILVLFPAVFHPFLTMSPTYGCGYVLPEEALNYFYYSIPLLITNLIRLYMNNRNNRGAIRGLASI